MSQFGRQLLLAMLLGWAGFCSASVVIVTSEGSREYAEAVEVIKAQLVGQEVSIRPWQEWAAVPQANATLVISIGAPAYAAITEAAVGNRWGRIPVIAAMLPRAAYETQRRRAVVAGSAVWLDQPFQRQLLLLKLALGANGKVGVLLGPESRLWQPALERAAQEQGMLVGVYRVENEQQLQASLQRLVEENEALLAVPDALIFNSGSVQNILLATYRQRIPMIGFSPAYVRAGAVMALYSTPMQIGVQVARLARLALQGQALPPPQGPQDFTVGVNSNVARSLGLRLSDEALRMELLNREGM